jgi:enamine deaminase RidA (YjgF/YER057c/UK114 family)
MLIEPARQTLARLQGRQNRAARRRGMSRPASGFARAATKMNWEGGFRTKGNVDILFLSGETGRDPFEDAPCRTPEEERTGKGKVMSHNVKEQTRQCLEYIKNKLEMMDASLKHIVMFRYYLPRREDVFDMRGTEQEIG